jgi:phage terminase large subunit-like protein
MTQSPIVEVLTELVRGGAADEALASLTEQELWALAAAWELWQRPAQLIPPQQKLDETLGFTPGKPWPLWGRTWPGHQLRILLMIGGRGTGKSTANMREAHRRATDGRWSKFLCVAQTAERAIELFVDAEHGLVLGAPPWERPEKTAGPGGKGLRLRYPNGSEAIISGAGSAEWRGPEYRGAICTEVAYWSNATCLDSWNALIDAVRIGEGLILVDTTPSDGNPIIAQIKNDAECDKTVQWVRLPPGANSLFLVPGYEEDMRRRYAGTHREAEEIDGVEGGERGMVKRADIEAARRHLPTQLDRTIIVLDPVRTDPLDSKTHPVGLNAMGRGHDEQLYVLDDRSGILRPEGDGCWPQLAVDMYLEHRADCLVIETNSAGRLNAALVRTWAERRGWNVMLVELTYKTRHLPGTLYVKEVQAYGDKVTRFETAGQLYRERLVSHVKEANLDELERTLTNWHPKKRGAISPGDLDCIAWGCIELMGYYDRIRAGSKGQRQLNEAARQQHQQATERARQPVGYLQQHQGRGRERDTRSRI